MGSDALQNEINGLLAEKALKNVDARALMVDWATAKLAAGQDTPSLRVLAGQNAQTDADAIDQYFEKSAAELGCVLPGEKEVIHWYTVRSLRSLVEGRVEFDQGLTNIYRAIFYDREDERFHGWRSAVEVIIDLGEVPQEEIERVCREESEKLLRELETGGKS